jgi:hypothetical protein
MRAHPIALGCFCQPASVLEEAAVGVARITHAHKHGITGGLLQTLAVHQVRYVVSLLYIERLFLQGQCHEMDYFF